MENLKKLLEIIGMVYIPTEVELWENSAIEKRPAIRIKYDVLLYENKKGGYIFDYKERLLFQNLDLKGLEFILREM